MSRKSAKSNSKPIILATCPICGKEKSFGQSPLHNNLWVCFSPDHPAWAGAYFMGVMQGYWRELPSILAVKHPRDLQLTKIKYSVPPEREELIYLESFGYPGFDVAGGEILQRMWRYQAHRAMQLGLSFEQARHFAEQSMQAFRESNMLHLPRARAESSMLNRGDPNCSEPRVALQSSQSRHNAKPSCSRKPKLVLNVR